MHKEFSGLVFKDLHVKAVTSPPVTSAGSASLYIHPKKQEGLNYGESPCRIICGWIQVPTFWKYTGFGFQK